MDEPTHDYQPAEHEAVPVAQPQATAGETVPEQDTPQHVIPVTPSPAAASVAPAAPAKAASDDYMDQASFKELFQMVGAMLFVALLSAAGWHAAHYSGAWPY